MFTKIAVLVAIIATVWFGFRALERHNAIKDGRRKRGDRTMGERLRKSFREKTGGDADPDVIEDTELCRKCGAYIAVGTECNCK